MAVCLNCNACYYEAVNYYALMYSLQTSLDNISTFDTVSHVLLLFHNYHEACCGVGWFVFSSC